MKKIIFCIAAFLSCLIIFNSCTLNNANSTPTPKGAFLLAQVSPNAPTLNFTINSNIFDTGLIYGIYTPYVAANPGSYAFAVPNSTLPSTTVNIEANKYYSYFIIDSFNNLNSAFTNDVFKAPSGGDSVYIRFFNFCPNINEPINLYDSTHKVVLSSNRTFNDQGFNPQFTAFNELPSGNYILSLKTISGTLLKTQTIPLVGGKVFTLFAKGINGNTDTTKGLSIALLENYPQR